MKLLRYGNLGEERPGCLDDEGHIRDLSAHISDFAGASASVENINKLKALDLNSLPKVEGNPRLGACLAQAPNFFCIGLNYAKHAEETGLRIPREPIIFSKASSALSGPFDPIVIPKDSEKTDWEVELGVLIGREAYQINEDEVDAVISGYFIVNDLSERHFQTERSGQWIKGKSCPGFGPIGPWLVTKDEIADPQNLDLSLSIDGEVMQSSNTSDMIFSVRRIISYMSGFMRLQPGDIIATGTPQGVGMSREPARFLQAGETVEAKVQGLGAQRQSVISQQG